VTHGHTHAGPDPEPSPRIARLITTIAVGGLLLTIFGAVVLRPPSNVRDRLLGVSRGGAEYDGVVVRSDLGSCTGEGGEVAADDPFCANVTVRLLQGPDKGKTTLLVLPFAASTPDLSRGDEVVLAYDARAPEGLEYRLLDLRRLPALLWLGLAFAIAVVLLGRLRGIAALVGLLATLVVLLSYVLPALIGGRPPVLVAIVGGAAITFITLYLAHGFSHRTTTALIGTLSSLGVTALLAHVFVALTRLTGFASDEAVLLNIESATIDIGGLVLAGVIIGALGALDDVTVTQASAVWELRAANPALSRRELFRSGLRIGRDHIASTVNTLLLAYAGASLPLLLYFVAAEQSLGSVANQEVVATEIVRTLVGSIGLVFSVPITTWVAVRVASTTRPVREV
jgi:uncharacterized membrane protein